MSQSSKTISEGEENIVEMVELPSLQYLGLFDLPNLRGFYSGRGTLFDEKVSFPALENLCVRGVGLREIWKN